MQAKLNPLGKINFPGFQEILDFTSAGSESSTSVVVAGDTDKEYIAIVRNLNASNDIYVTLNADSGATSYGYQYILNSSGTITAARGTTSRFALCDENSVVGINMLTPTGFIKTCFRDEAVWSSGTTMSVKTMTGLSYNSTSNITSMEFTSSSGNFAAGTRIVVYARRSNV